jgi:hypothetical protein
MCKAQPPSYSCGQSPVRPVTSTRTPDEIGAPAGGASSLVSYKHNGTQGSGGHLPPFRADGKISGQLDHTPRDEHGLPTMCPRVKFDFHHVPTGTIVRGRCNAYKCRFCGPKKLHNLELVLCWPRPERFVTLTLAPEDPEQRRNQVKNLTSRLRKAGHKWEIAWTTEVNPKGTGYHIHALQIGSYVPQDELQDKWGGRITHIFKLRHNVGMAAEYVVKEGLRQIRAEGYVLKNATGSRPVHVSRGYFRGQTMGEVRAEVNKAMYGVVPGLEGWKRISRNWVPSDVGNARVHSGRALDDLAVVETAQVGQVGLSDGSEHGC